MLENNEPMTKEEEENVSVVSVGGYCREVSVRSHDQSPVTDYNRQLAACSEL